MYETNLHVIPRIYLFQQSNPKVNIPLHSAEHYYLVSKPFEG